MQTLVKQSASNFLTCSLSNESRTGKPACRSCHIDLIDKRFVERNIDSYGPTGISKQRNSEQDGPRFNRRLHIPVLQDIIDGTRRLQPTTSALNRFSVLTQSDGCVPNSLFQSLARRKASFYVREPDAEGAVRVLFYNCYVMRRHRFKSCLRLSPPAGQLVNVAYQSYRQISLGVRHGDYHVPLRMFERVMIAVDTIQHPSISFQHPDKFAAISFHVPAPKQRRESLESLNAFDQGCVKTRSHHRAYALTPIVCVYK